MTYRELLAKLQTLTNDQLDCDLTAAVVECGSVEVHHSGFVDPNDFINAPEDERESLFLDEIDDSILDKGHPYFFVSVG